jgi:hypothetical protein
MEQKSVLKQIREVLRENGIDAYYPTQHEGECIEPYVVIKYNGATLSDAVSSEQVVYDIICYVPEKKYSALPDYVAEVKSVLAKLFPMIRKTGTETADYYDDTVKGHMISVEYVNYRKMENWR